MTKQLKNRTMLLHLFGWVIFIVFNALLFYAHDNPVPISISVKILFSIVLFYINYYILIPKFFFKRKFVIYTVYAVLLIGATTFAFVYIKSSYFSASEDIHRSRYIFSVFTFIMALLTGILVRLITKWNKDEKLQLRITTRKATTELQNLKNQINPHFLFNTLNSIYALTLKNSEKSPDAVMMLSDLMRYMLYETNSDYVLLSKEIEYIENYIDLQKLQIANSETINLSINGKIHHQKISPLILISFIENAFKYGTDFSGSTKIDIDIYIKGDELQFKCENIIGNRTEASNKEYGGIGIQNTKERLKLSYSDKHWLNIEEDEKSYKVSLNLKLD